jgi:carboxyl-terminal processing protease
VVKDAGNLGPPLAFMPPNTYKEMQKRLRLIRIGNRITMKDEILTVVSPIEDTPAGDQPGSDR